MPYDWEVFSPAVGTPSVTIASYGLIFNRAAIEVLGKPEFVRLAYDRQHKVIGVFPVDVEVEDAFVFAERERNGSVRLNSKDFIRFILRYLPRTTFDSARRYLARWDEENRLLIVDLEQPYDGVDEESEAEEGGEETT